MQNVNDYFLRKSKLSILDFYWHKLLFKKRNNFKTYEKILKYSAVMFNYN